MCSGRLSRPDLLAGIGIELEAELGGDHHLVTEGSESFAHEFFVGERAIRFSGIEECDAAFDRRPNQRDPLLLVYRLGRSQSSVPCSRARWPILPDCFFQVCVFAFLLLTKQIKGGYSIDPRCCRWELMRFPRTAGVPQVLALFETWVLTENDTGKAYETLIPLNQTRLKPALSTVEGRATQRSGQDLSLPSLASTRRTRTLRQAQGRLWGTHYKRAPLSK